MAECNVASVRTYCKPTFIYVLMDPDTLEVRYLGKTVKPIERRLAVHISHAKRVGHKRHVAAWIRSLLDVGKKPIIQSVETVSPNGDWVAAEQRWIAELLEAGADLCNLTDGGEGAPGYKPSPEEIERFRASLTGERNHNYGKAIPPHVLEAMLSASREKRKDPEWVAWWKVQRKAGYTPESRAKSNAALVDPVNREKAKPIRAKAMRNFDTRVVIGVKSRDSWEKNREKIIAAQNRGKGPEWKKKQSEIRTALWADPVWRASILEKRRQAFIHKRQKLLSPT